MYCEYLSTLFDLAPLKSKDLLSPGSFFLSRGGLFFSALAFALLFYFAVVVAVAIAVAVVVVVVAIIVIIVRLFL
ncbi:hypothetical protein B5M47_04040 [candidate division CPR3 bacterium 4484_211]|uniref:Uncharacterized protein n=1 Tax=candidate division CPR3 bacterium 4484_211 TaxID=1968527 RepID=A0A1W9NW02_UNCC3|nr:MAG: hypothetical protein B5M47_04040 [candidate division CPR3 bacterium 4484_211]